MIKNAARLRLKLQQNLIPYHSRSTLVGISSVQQYNSHLQTTLKCSQNLHRWGQLRTLRRVCRRALVRPVNVIRIVVKTDIVAFGRVSVAVIQRIYVDMPRMCSCIRGQKYLAAAANMWCSTTYLLHSHSVHLAILESAVRQTRR